MQVKAAMQVHSNFPASKVIRSSVGQVEKVIPEPPVWKKGAHRYQPFCRAGGWISKILLYVEIG